MSRGEETIAAVRQAMGANADYVAKLTRDVSPIPSVDPCFAQSPAINNEARVQDRLARHLVELDFRVNRWDVTRERSNILADWGCSRLDLRRRRMCQV